MRSALLKVADGEISIIIIILTRIITNMLHQVHGDIAWCIAYRFAIEQKQHPFKICQLITTKSPRQAIATAGVRHQIVNNGFLTEEARAISFVIP